jgi:putative nucleotidyltransferase with HDIG domain
LLVIYRSQTCYHFIMANKLAQKTRSRARSGRLDGVKKFFSTLPEQSVIDAGVGVLIIVIVSLLLMRNYQRAHVEPLAPGAIATESIIAPRDLKIIDESQTRHLQEQAAASELPIFNFDPARAREATGVIKKIFEAGRQSMREAEEAGTSLSPEDLRRLIEDRTYIQLTAEQIAVLLENRFDLELEKLMVGHLESVMMTPIIESRSQLRELGASSIQYRNPETGYETIVNDISSVRDEISASAALRSERIEWGGYDARARKVLGEVLAWLVKPNLFYNAAETEARRQDRRESVAAVIVPFNRGEPVVRAGETVTSIKAAALSEASLHRPISQRAIEFAGTIVVVTLMMIVLWQYLSRHQRKHLRVRRHFLLQIACFIINLGLMRLFFMFASAMSLWATREPFNSQMSYRYLAPLAVGAALITILTDAHAAFIFSALLTVFVGVFSDNVYLAAYTLMSSAGAIYHLQHCRDRTALVRAGLWIGAINAASALALDFLGASEADPLVILFDLFCAAAGGMLAAMVASIFLPLFEWLFEITTSIKLLELSNFNLPLLKQLAERAPGTYHHSIMVGQLASAAAESIGADALFARVACYYHDIGKSVRPTYFVENQSYMENRHDGLSPKMSSIVLANHVKQGIELARQHKLPPRLIAIIPQHHGTGLMKYFYYKARRQMGDRDDPALEQEFRYPGPKPQTKEAAIVMIADSVEAASRTVQDPTPTKLRNMIDMIITRIRDDGQLDECDITLRELRMVADSFVKTLMGVYHHRIAYPGYDFNRPGAPSMLSQLGPAADAPNGDGKLSGPGSEPAAANEAKEAETGARRVSGD